MTFLLKLWKWILKIPVLFVHFPGPTIMLVVLVAIGAGSVASFAAHKLETIARADLKVELAQCKAEHASIVATAANERTDIIQAAAARQAKIDELNRAAFLAMARALTDTSKDDAAIAALAKSIEDLHRDPKFDCRKLPLPDDHLQRLRLEEARPHPAEAGSH